MKTQFLNAFKIVAFLAVMLAWYGCERDREAAELRPYVYEANDYIEAHFGVRYACPDQVTVLWGHVTECTDTGTIVVDLSARGNDAQLKAYIRHEMFHLATWLDESDTDTYHGIRISDWIEWRHQ